MNCLHKFHMIRAGNCKYDEHGETNAVNVQLRIKPDLLDREALYGSNAHPHVTKHIPRCVTAV